MNGRLPNLDLVNLFVRLSEKSRIEVTIYDSNYAVAGPNATLDVNFGPAAHTLLRGIVRQAS